MDDNPIFLPWIIFQNVTAGTNMTSLDFSFNTPSDAFGMELTLVIYL